MASKKRKTVSKLAPSITPPQNLGKFVTKAEEDDYQFFSHPFCICERLHEYSHKLCQYATMKKKLEQACQAPTFRCSTYSARVSHQHSRQNQVDNIFTRYMGAI